MMKVLDQTSESGQSDSTSAVNRYFSKTNFAQIPNVLFLYAIREGDPFDLVVYGLLFSSCFNRRKGDFNTKFNVSTISEILETETELVKNSIRRLKKHKHIRLDKITKLDDGDVYLEIWLSTRNQGLKKWICDEPVG